MKAFVYVRYKESVLDPQGEAVARALRGQGYQQIESVRQGKFFELRLRATSRGAAEKLLAEISERVLSNPIIEEFRFELPSDDGPRS
ncbi:MAG TPA: phosphoribosylformylglycinamidine synthase subunit PurS [Acidobacteriota bacterium]